MCGGGGDTDYTAQEHASKAEADKLRYEKDVEVWKQNMKAQTDKRGQASKDSLDRRAQRSLLSKGGEWAYGMAKSFYGDEKAPDRPASLLASTTVRRPDGTLMEEEQDIFNTSKNLITVKQ